MLHQDSWLEAQLGKPAYHLSDPFEVDHLPGGFVDAKIPGNRLDLVHRLLEVDFFIVETLITFVQKFSLKLEERVTCRFATAEDEKEVILLGSDAFSQSRFYQDPQIKRSVATSIKREWVRNFFRGKRGTQMIVAHHKQSIMGFLLLIDQVIDLIATGPEFKQQGVAKHMIQFANQHSGLLKAGTQSTNIPSINLYNSSGFVFEKLQYVMHRHTLCNF